MDSMPMSGGGGYGGGNPNSAYGGGNSSSYIGQTNDNPQTPYGTQQQSGGAYGPGQRPNGPQNMSSNLWSQMPMLGNVPWMTQNGGEYSPHTQSNEFTAMVNAGMFPNEQAAIHGATHEQRMQAANWMHAGRDFQNRPDVMQSLGLHTSPDPSVPNPWAAQGQALQQRLMGMRNGYAPGTLPAPRQG